MFVSKMAQISCLPFCHDFAANNNNAENDQKLTAIHFFGAPLHPIRACLYITNKKDRDEMSWSFLHAYYQLKRLIL